jgi:hypothetical protein
MPNYCFNTLVITGSKEDIDQFLRENQETPETKALHFGMSVPMPPEIENVRDWCFLNWGTRSLPYGDEYSEMERESDTRVTFTFETVWTPPNVWVKRMGVKYPTLHFKLWYDEPNSPFRGHVIMKDGKITHEVEEEDYEEIDEDSVYGNDEIEETDLQIRTTD